MCRGPCPECPFSSCENFLYGFKGTPSGRASRPARPERAGREAGVIARGRERDGGKPPETRGQQGLACSGAAAARALRPEALRSRALPPGGLPAPAGRRLRAPTLPDDRARTAAGPSSTRRAFSRRARSSKCARCARVLRMALRATLDCDLPRQDLGTYPQDGTKDGPTKNDGRV